jgi:hypothetical protein
LRAQTAAVSFFLRVLQPGIAISLAHAKPMRPGYADRGKKAKSASPCTAFIYAKEWTAMASIEWLNYHHLYYF